MHTGKQPSRSSGSACSSVRRRRSARACITRSALAARQRRTVSEQEPGAMDEDLDRASGQAAPLYQDRTLSFFLRSAVKGSADVRAEFVERRTGILKIPCAQLWLGRSNKHCYQNEPTDKGKRGPRSISASLSLRLAPDPICSLLRRNDEALG